MQSFDKSFAKIIKSLKSSYGADFFNSLTLQLNLLIEADYTFIAKLDKPQNSAKTISLATHDGIAENFEYALSDTPCANVSEDAVCIYPARIADLFPKDQMLIDMGIQGYVGTPLHDSHGEVIGLVVALYENTVEDSDAVTTLFELFSGRISAELERESKERELIDLNESLEDQVRIRTSELSNALETIQFAKDKLVEQEKMAALGNLVAGVAHEINTPLGIAVLSSSNIQHTIDLVSKKITNSSLTKLELESAIENVQSSEQALSFNLDRAVKLVENFKEMAVDVNTEAKVPFDVNDRLSTLVDSLKPFLDRKKITIEMQIEDGTFNFCTIPSKLSQVVTNVVTNCVNHAFDNEQSCANRKVTINVQAIDKHMNIRITDNGCGMPEAVQQKIFDPFFTTKRGQGGTGLGLNIVKNIIEHNLKGELAFTSSLGGGTEFTMTLPSLADKSH